MTTIALTEAELGDYSFSLPDAAPSEVTDNGLRVFTPAPNLMMVTAAVVNMTPDRQSLTELMGRIEHELQAEGQVARLSAEALVIPGTESGFVFEWRWGAAVKERLIAVIAFGPGGDALLLKINFPESELDRYRPSADAITASIAGVPRA